MEGKIIVIEDAPIETDYSSEGASIQQQVRREHFWFSKRNRFIGDLMAKIPGGPRGKRMVEFGCSNGFVMQSLEEADWNVAGNDMHLSGLRNASNNVSGTLFCAPFERLNFSEPLDVVGFFDVIEHLDNDRLPITHALKQLKPGGHIAVTVPAFNQLWSAFDVILGHKRRYTAKQLRSLFEDLGLEVVHIKYAFWFSYPIVWLQRRLTRDNSNPLEHRKNYYKVPPIPVNAGLGLLCDIERWMARIGIQLPFGTSVMGLARKPA